MIYKNTKTGVVIKTTSVCSGGNWVEVEKEQPKKTTSTKRAKKDDEEK